MQITDFITFIQDSQRLYHDTIVNDLETIKSSGSLITTLGLMGVGFLYGIFHAIGPGHGKVIVSSYMLANESSLKRGLWVVALSSLMQAIVAITLVVSFFYLLNLARSEIERTTNMLEIASYGLVIVLGFSLVWRGVKEFLNVKPYTHHHSHHHDHHDGCCNHQHIPDAKQLAATYDMRALSLMIASIGMRPCTGAVLLLFFACIMGAVWAGILATFAMAVGTALTTGLLAIITVKSKNMALTFFKTTDKGMKLAHAVLSVCGGAIVIILSASFLVATLTAEPTSPLPTKSPARNLPLMHLPSSK